MCLQPIRAQWLEEEIKITVSQKKGKGENNQHFIQEKKKAFFSFTFWHIQSSFVIYNKALNNDGMKRPALLMSVNAKSFNQTFLLHK